MQIKDLKCLDTKNERCSGREGKGKEEEEGEGEKEKEGGGSESPHSGPLLRDNAGICPQ